VIPKLLKKKSQENDSAVIFSLCCQNIKNCISFQLTSVIKKREGMKSIEVCFLFSKTICDETCDHYKKFNGSNLSRKLWFSEKNFLSIIIHCVLSAIIH